MKRSLLMIMATSTMLWLAGCTQLQPADDIAQIEAGNRTTCVVTTAGAVECAGSLGVPGSSAVDYGNSLTSVPGLSSGVTDISLGLGHACVAVNGTAQCWGAAAFGALGNGAGGGLDPNPATVLGLPANDPVIDVETGGHASCARLLSGPLYCWGKNTYGELGVGDTADRYEATPVVGFDGVSTTQDAEHVTLGVDMMCVAGPHILYCSGNDDDGQQGNGSSVEPSTVPTPVLSGTPGQLSRLISTGRTVCRVRSGSGLMCWGRNTGNVFADGPMPVPTTYDGFNDVLLEPAISTNQICGILDGLYVTCGGVPYLGDGSDASQLTPVIVSGSLARPSIQISSGDGHNCVLDTTDGAWCWGRNAYGQLSDGTDELRLEPVPLLRASS